MIRKISLIICALFIANYAIGQKSTLQKQGTATQLLVDKEPFLILGGELGNSSASCTEDIERIFPKLERMGLNTVLVPINLDLTAPTENDFYVTLTKKILDPARTNNL